MGTRPSGDLTRSILRGLHARVHLRALLFDYGGTLDGDDHWGARFARLYRDAELDVAPSLLRDAFERAEAAVYAEPDVNRASLRQVIDLHVRIQLEALDCRRPALQRVLVDRFVADSEAALARHRALLGTFAARFKLGVVSNFYGNVERILTDAGLAPLLSAIVDSAVVGMAKPEPRIFTYALHALGTAAAETLHVGDSYGHDVLGARRAGLHTAWLTADAEAPTDGIADLRCRTLTDFPAHLSTFAAGPMS